MVPQNENYFALDSFPVKELKRLLKKYCAAQLCSQSQKQ